jgi:serpin B
LLNAELSWLDSFADANNEFALAMYAQLRCHRGNLFCSPFSIRTALAMVYAGARSQTAAEMCATLRCQSEGDAFHRVIGRMIERFNVTGRRSNVSVANSLWAQEGDEPLPEFIELSARYYGGTLNMVDFMRAADVVRTRINEWAASRTKNRIQHLIAPGALDAMSSRPTGLVVVNAVYFKGTWQVQFDEDRTHKQPFYVEGGGTSRVLLMGCTERIRFSQADGYQAVDLAFQDSEVSMLVLLPDRRDGLEDLQRTLSVEMLNDCTAHMEDTVVQLFLPKFKITWGTVELSEHLRALGTRLLFDSERCDLSGINGHRPPSERAMFVSRVLHKAFVDVNEHGAEAAAATAVTVRFGRAATPEPVSIPLFRADHPFLVALRDRTSGVILFLGRIVDPAQDQCASDPA